jgi:hypothetical protein
MDEIMNKMGSYWLGQKANKEMSSAGDDLEVRARDRILSLLCFAMFCSLLAACFCQFSFGHRTGIYRPRRC